MAAWMVDEPDGKPISSGVNRMRPRPSESVAWVACVRITLPEGLSASS